MFWEALEILFLRRRFAGTAEMLQLRRQQLVQQRGAFGFRCRGQVIFDAWPLSSLQSIFEGFTDFVYVPPNRKRQRVIRPVSPAHGLISFSQIFRIS
jgi:hypothetical protein